MANTTTEIGFLQHIIQDQLHRHSGFKVDDLYKLMYQATCGGEHFLTNKSKARKNLIEEWESMERIPKGETLLEIIDPRGEIMRVNLRVYKKIGGTVQKIFEYFIRSVEAFKKDQDRLVRYWEAIMEMAKKETIPFSRGILEDFYIDVGRKGFPAIHHSESYLDANRPSYRLVLKGLWEGFNKKGTV